MFPSFALDLSLDGIRLLFRADGGWTVVGDVALEDPALADRLAALRASAEALAPGAVTTELVIPPPQIRYVTIPRPATDGPVTAEDLLPALDGLTPLSPEELAFDWEADGDAVRLALVDRITLAEAEAFAAAHRFNPVRFGARPTPAQFPRTPDFGPTDCAAPAPAFASIRSEDSTPPEPVEDDVAAQAAPEAECAAPTLSLASDAPADGPEPAALPVAEPAPDDRAADTISPDALARTLTAPPPSEPALEADPAPVPEPAPADSAPPPLGAASLARTLAAPRAGSRPPYRTAAPAPRARPDRRLLAAGGAVTATAVALALAFGLARDPAASLPDTPPEVALAAPALLAPAPPSSEAQMAAAPADAAPASLAAAGIATPEPAADPVADTEAPVLLENDAPDIRLARAPTVPAPPRTESTETIYLASIDPVTRASDAIALLPSDAFRSSPRPAGPVAAAGAAADTASPDIREASADPVVIVEGRPPIAPPAAPGRAAAAAPAETPAPEAAAEPAVETAAAPLPDSRPRARPTGLVERNERATLGGRTRTELAALKPLARPASEQAEAAVAAPAGPPSDYAVAVSRIPRDRPADLATRVATASAIAAALAAPPPPPPAEVPVAAVAAAPAPAPAPAPAAAAPTRQAAAPTPPAAGEDQYDDGEPETVAAAAPSIPTSASVARQATIQNAMSLRQINLIGVYGTDRDRRALVRLSNGRYVKVKVGDRIDGGQVAAIGRDELRYIKSGRNVTLQVPAG